MDVPSPTPLFTDAPVYCCLDFFNYWIPKIQLPTPADLLGSGTVNKRDPINNVLSPAKLNQTQKLAPGRKTPREDPGGWMGRAPVLLRWLDTPQFQPQLLLGLLVVGLYYQKLLGRTGNVGSRFPLKARHVSSQIFCVFTLFHQQTLP